MHVGNFCIRTSQWKLCYVENVCLAHELDINILLVVCGVNKGSYCGLFLRETFIVRELNFKKGRHSQGLWGRRFKISDLKLGLFPDLSDGRGILRE